jgi:hypothetical protein
MVKRTDGTRKNRRESKTMKLPKYSSTFYAVTKWHKKMFEKLGWMVLAQAKGDTYKVEAYKQSLDKLEKTLEHLMTEYENHNRLHDLRVMLMNVRVLKEHVRKDF